MGSLYQIQIRQMEAKLHFFILQLMGLFARAVMHCAGSRLTVVVGSRVKTR